jgi:hypothetical protein
MAVYWVKRKDDTLMVDFNNFIFYKNPNLALEINVNVKSDKMWKNTIGNELRLLRQHPDHTTKLCETPRIFNLWYT